MTTKTKKKRKDHDDDDFEDDDDDEFEEDGKKNGKYQDDTTVEITVSIGGISNVELTVELDVDFNDIAQAEIILANAVKVLRRAIPAASMANEEAMYVKKNPHIAVKANGEVEYRFPPQESENKPEKDDARRADEARPS